ncbi:large subunit ribosomal protein L1 [Nannochloropsis gaditana CCMP526]|uniref:Ribosomal protein n=1 Tax=Nannochloropsis gaditana TaxID=72520 RepID=W7TMB4_9STRA|nr:large subunit ribosomal protein L1 [Nannochloropsis gaditana CCMP526]EKU21096.1 large subunit ribosomal protein L1 [Nannochloropsis gaditana CCMP526]EWM27182.1 50s ribosomal protein l1 [Nannochloropsis gaditana]|eukprot:XP_005855271.1 large subunit ribosomal protein L1 [Nannochloropsis gaditana CCMP526]
MLRRIRHQEYRVSTALLGSLRGFTAETVRKRRPPSTTVGKAVASLNSARASQRSSSPVTSSHSLLQSSPSAPSSSRVTEALPIRDALAAVLQYAKEEKRRNFTETVDLAIQLGVDPRKPNQSVRGVQTLPNGTGKSVRVAVFARGDDAEAAKAAGAAVVGAEDLVKAIQDGELAFDRCVATPEVMPLVSRVARVLGPRGLMPNPKMGTVTKDVGAAVKSAMAGQAQFKADRFGMVHVGVGKVSFEPEALLENIRVLMVALGNAKPEGAKGKYFKGVFLTSTMGKAVPVEVATVDPRSSRFMLEAALTT